MSLDVTTANNWREGPTFWHYCRVLRQDVVKFRKNQRWTRVPKADIENLYVNILSAEKMGIFYSCFDKGNYIRIHRYSAGGRRVEKPSKCVLTQLEEYTRES